MNGLDFRPEHLDGKARIRIIFTPLDELLGDLAPGITALCTALSIPPEFLTERLRGVCHSFGTRTNEQGFAAWFHYLCKAVEPALAARHRWYKSAFFLRKDQHGNVTLVLFGPTPGVRERLDQFIAAKSWHDVEAEPLALFDLVLDGLFREIDATVWKLLHEISGLENVSFPSLRNLSLCCCRCRCRPSRNRNTNYLPNTSSGSSKSQMLEAVHSEQRRRSTLPNCTVGPHISST